MATLLERSEAAISSIEASAQVQSDVIAGGINDVVPSPAGDIRSVSNAINVMSQVNITGDWLTATGYLVKDLVKEAGVWYICLVAHTSGVFATDLAAGNWAVHQTLGEPDILTSSLIDIPIEQSRVFNSASFTTMFDHSTGIGDPFLQRNWSTAIINSNGIRMEIVIAGAANSPFEFSMKWVKLGPVTVFESNALITGGLGSKQIAWFGFNPLTGNVVNWDPATDPLGGINGNEVGASEWEMQISAGVGGGAGYQLMLARLHLLKA